MLATRSRASIQMTASRSSYATKLIVADSHPSAEEPIRRLNLDGDAIVLRHSHEEQVDDEYLSSAITFATQELGLTSVILLGHSAIEIPVNHRRRFRANPLLTEFAETQYRVHEAKKKLAHQVSQMLEKVAEITEPEECDLEIHGVVYIQESGMFLMYLPENQDFVPFEECIRCC